MAYRTSRPRPSAELHADAGQSAEPRPVLLRTGRGDVKVSVPEAVALAGELLAAAARVAPVPLPALVLPLAERVAAQSEILQARAHK